MKKIGNYRKGFVQLPILAVVIGVFALASAGAGVVLYTQSNSPTTASVQDAVSEEKAERVEEEIVIEESVEDEEIIEEKEEIVEEEVFEEAQVPEVETTEPNLNLDFEALSGLEDELKKLEEELAQEESEDLKEDEEIKKLEQELESQIDLERQEEVIENSLLKIAGEIISYLGEVHMFTSNSCGKDAAPYFRDVNSEDFPPKEEAIKELNRLMQEYNQLSVQNNLIYGYFSQYPISDCNYAIYKDIRTYTNSLIEVLRNETKNL